MNDIKTNLEEAATPAPDALITVVETPPAPELAATILVPTPGVDSTVSGGSSSAMSGRNMMLMLAFVILLLVVFILLDKAKMRRVRPAERVEREPEAPPAIIPAPTEDADEIAAVIAAAVTLMTETQAVAMPAPAAPPPLPPDALRVRRVRRNPASGPAWNRAGREEQVYSRMVG
ncbi:hypothetical protein AGMMS49992_00880 [Clostridia bacterium]|nr:hypothetical protein AGMMS49992_00880 [Clostridia bacterium]